MSDELLTVAEVAAGLKVNPQTVRNWIDNGTLEATRVGERRVRILQSELNRFLKLKDQAAQATAARPRAPKRRRGTARDVEAVEGIIEQMLAVASGLPVGSRLARELAESAGRLQLVLRVPGGRDSRRLEATGGDVAPA